MSVRRGSRVSQRREPAFNAQAFLDSALVTKSVTSYARGESIFAQGDASLHVMYIQSGGVKLSVVSKHGKEAVVAMLGLATFSAVPPDRSSAWARCRDAQHDPVTTSKMVALRTSSTPSVCPRMLTRNIRLKKIPSINSSTRREAAGAHAAAARALRQDSRSGAVQSARAGGHHRHHALARELFLNKFRSSASSYDFCDKAAQLTAGCHPSD